MTPLPPTRPQLILALYPEGWMAYSKDYPMRSAMSHGEALEYAQAYLAYVTPPGPARVSVIDSEFWSGRDRDDFAAQLASDAQDAADREGELRHEFCGDEPCAECKAEAEARRVERGMELTREQP